MKRRTVIVDGPLASRMRRLSAARDRELGLEILTLPREMVSTERDGDQRPWRDQRRLAALEKPREPR